MIGLIWVLMTSLNQDPTHDGVTAEIWLARIMEGDPQNHETACQAFVMMGEQAFPFLRRTLTDKDSFLKRRLLRWNTLIPSLTATWTRDFQQRNAALQAVAALGTNATALMPEVLIAAHDQEVPINPAWLIKAIDEIGLDGVPETARFLQDHQLEPLDRRNYILAAWIQIFDQHSLPSHLRPMVLPPLLSTLRDPHLESEAVYACQLAQWFGGAEAPVLDPLLELLHHESSNVRVASIRTLQEISVQPARVAPALMQLLSDSNPQVRRVAIQALPGLKEHGHAAGPRLGTLTQDPVDSVRMAALNALANMGPAASEQSGAIASLLQDAPDTMRAQAARILILVQPDPQFTVPILIKALDDEVWEVRCHAAESLGRLGEPAAPAVPALARKLTDTREAVQITAVEALGRIGSASAPVIPDLYSAWNNNQSALGPYVKKAIQEIEQTAAMP